MSTLPGVKDPAPAQAVPPAGAALLPAGARILLAVLVVAGAVAFAAGLALDPTRTWLDFLAANFYFLSVSLAAGCFVAIQYVTNAGWATVLRRVPEAMTAYVPIGGLLLLALIPGMGQVYHWTHPEGDAILTAKAAFLNVPVWTAQVVIFTLVWTFLLRRIVGNSRAQDRSGDLAPTARNVRLSAAFLAVFAVTYSLAAFTWVQSVEPHWYSTIYPWYLMASTFVGGLSAIAVLLIVLARRGRVPGLGEAHFHDLGKYLFAFSMFWGYLWFCQYMLIWYANIPEETAPYIVRTGSAWHALFLANGLVNLILPFALLPARVKKDRRTLLAAALVLFAGHALDLYLAVLPSAHDLGPRFGLVELGLFAGLAALFLLSFDRAFRRASPVPARDPYLAESLHHHG